MHNHGLTFIIKLIAVIGLSFFSLNNFAHALPTIKRQFLKVDVPNISPVEEVKTIYQDSMGSLWFATEKGLLNYNGNTTNLYSSSTSSPNSISNNHVSAVAEDKSGYLWIATREGVNRFDKKSEHFTSYLIRPTSGSKYVNNRIYDVFVDSKNRVWVTAASALYLYDRTNDSFSSLRPWHDEYSYKKLSIWAYTVFEDAQGVIWVGTSAGGLVQFDHSQNTFTHYSNHKDNPNQFPADFINVIRSKSPGKLLVGTGSGLYEFDSHSGNARRIFELDIPDSVIRLEKDNDGNWWAVTDDELLRLSNNLTTIERFGMDNSTTNTQRNPAPMALLVDKENNIWTSFQDGGVHYISNDSKRIRRVKLDSHTKQNNHTTINGLMESDDALWVATERQLVKISKKTNRTSSVIQTNGEKTQLGRYYSLHKAQDGKVYVGRSSGFSVIGLDGSIQDYPTNTKLPTDKAVVDMHSNVWLMAGERGVVIHNTSKKSHPFFQQQKMMIGDFSPTATFIEISQDRKSVFILYENKGLYKYDIEKQLLSKVPNSESVRSYVNMYQSEDGKLYLFNGDRKVQVIDPVTMESSSIELPLENIGCFLQSDDDVLWLAKLKGGLFRWEPKSQSLIAMRKSEGVTSNGLTGRFCHQMNGELLFSGYDGLLHISNEVELINPTPANTVISSIHVKDQLLPIKIAEQANPNSNSPDSLHHLKLKHNEGPVTINFSSLSFTDSQSNRFKYQVKNLSKGWIELPAQSKSITLDYLPSGTFEFEVLGSNADGVWGSLPARITLTIAPPFWLTWWAQLIYVLAIILTTLLVFHLRTKAITKRAKQLKEMVDQRTWELEKEKNLVEKLLTNKRNEFANLSHEFRTPLTLILGPIQNLLRSNIRSTTRNKLEMAKRNGFRVLRMVDQLLHMEKFHVEHIVKNKLVAIKPIASLITQSFKDLAEEKGVQLIVEKIEDINLYLTEDAFEKILLNLLSNAIKYTPSGGKVTVSIYRQSSSEVIIKVQDTGVGIPEDMHKQIFERYNRVLDSYSEQITGAGIGLALVKEIVDAHQGSISVSSSPDKGSTFKVSFLQSLEQSQNIEDRSINTELLNLELESIREQHSDLTPPTQQAETIDTPSDDSRSTLLVIEDNPDMREYIIECLSNHYICLQASNGREGVAMAVKSIPDLIISDVMMPEMSGYEVSKLVKQDEKTSHIPVILLTARGDRESRLKGWKEHADEYLTKPFDHDELNIRVESLLSIRDILRSRFSQEIIQNSKNSSQLKTTGLCEKDQEFIEKLNKHCEENFSNPDFDTLSMAANLAMSDRQLQRKLKALVDRSPNDYLRSYRLMKAKEELGKGLRISEVAFNVGFSSQAYFSKCFKAQFGMTAKEYQRSGEQSEELTTTN
ncbi:ATP-binding protein [Pleionea sp. CnH1-48]|uniref:hybrid sensor histidine kinase/response regulator transcription factor n=1 Tax=Pleionea sp. CnH1-48 TaxID=2954494 RepID=UPI002097EC14|nr:ATP-binding protein [Pleionea sp. CnH1-48]MCO7226644.1 ATP-binding protein [Pleionea sp. CnH1-48]